MLSLGSFRLFCYMIYQHWRARNAKIHGNPFSTPTIIAASIMESVSCCLDSPYWRYWGTNQPSRLSTSIFWCPPPPKWIKLNVDGAVLPNNLAGIGVVVRDHNGSLLLAAGSSLHHWDPGGVELAALLSLRSLLSPDMIAAAGAIIESDCKNVLQFCERSLQRSAWLEQPFLEHDLSILSEFNQVRFRHLPREANRLADFCAKFGASSTFVWHNISEVSTEFLDIYQEDSATMHYV